MQIIELHPERPLSQVVPPRNPMQGDLDRLVAIFGAIVCSMMNDKKIKHAWRCEFDEIIRRYEEPS